MGCVEWYHREGWRTTKEGCHHSQVTFVEASLNLDFALRWAGDLVLTEDWIPHMPVTPEDSEVFASQFTLDNTRSAYFKREKQIPPGCG